MLAAAVVLALTACSSPEPLAGIDLPPAVTPANIEGGGWAITFSREFDPGYWQAGQHIYTMALVCDAILDEPMRTSPVFLESSPDQEIIGQPVYLRLVGLSHLLLGPKTLNAINPQQATKAALTVIGVDADAARRAFDTCTGAFYADGGDPIAMTPEEPFLQ